MGSSDAAKDEMGGGGLRAAAAGLPPCHLQSALTLALALDRAHAGAGRPLVAGGGPGGRMMGYEDFICLFMALEDKTMPSSLR